MQKFSSSSSTNGLRPIQNHIVHWSQMHGISHEVSEHIVLILKGHLHLYDFNFISI